MACHKDVSSSPQLSEKQRLLNDHNPHNFSEAIQVSERGGGGGTGATAKPSAKQHVCNKTRCGYLYAGPGRKPRFLKQAESYVNRQLQAIDCTEPKFQELKLQVYREVFGCFIEEFKTYKPLLDAIKKEYENTLASLQDQVRELEPLQDRLRLVTEECNRKIVARWAEERTEIRDLKREQQQMQRDMQDMREQEKGMQAVVAHLQSELSNQYLQYRKEHDARKLLIVKLNDLSSFAKEENTTDENAEDEGNDLIKLKLALKVCREDLKKAQVELNRVQAEYWDVVPRYDWETLEHTHKGTLQQLERLQGDFDQLKSEYDILLEIHKRDKIQSEAESSVTRAIQIGDDVHHRQNPLKSRLLKELINFDSSESGTLTVEEFREALRTAFPLKSHQATEELVAMAQNELDSSNKISYRRLYSPSQESDDKNFFSVVKKQSIEERGVCIRQLSVQLQDKGEVSVVDLQAALMHIDPALDCDALDWNLCLAFQVNQEELKQYDTMLDTETIIHRLSVTDTSRTEPPQQ